LLEHLDETRDLAPVALEIEEGLEDAEVFAIEIAIPPLAQKNTGSR
jgi:hypothetical protein